MKTAEQLVNFSHGNVEAMVKSGRIVATGMQELAKQMTATTQASLEEMMNAFRALTTVRSFKDAVDLQTSFARSTMEKALTGTGQVAETSFRVAEQAVAPIAGRVSLAVETFGKAA